MEKISVSDLSIGDYVRVKMCKWDYDDPDTLDAKVLSIEGNSVGVGYDNSGIVMSAFVDDLQPIPITAEVLENNGFSHNGNKWYTPELFTLERWSKGWSIVIACTCGDYVCEVCTIKYVHQLQHALRLVGVEKEIVL